MRAPFVVLAVVAIAGCSRRPVVPFEKRLAALERGDSSALVFVDLFDVPFVRESARPVDDAALPKRYPPVPGAFGRPVSPRGLTLDAEPKFSWLPPEYPSEAYQLILWDSVDGAPGAAISNQRVEGTSHPSPFPLERGKSYFWSVLDPSKAAGAQVEFEIADEASASALRSAAATLERADPDRSTALLLQTNLFEVRGFFGEASLALLELWRLHPKSEYLAKRAQRLSLYLTRP
jgi:hypothetical protein